MSQKASDKAIKLGKASATGSFHLFGGRIISTIITAIGTMILGALILETDYGLYTIALIPLSTLLLFHEWGIGSAITRYCAQCRATNNQENLKKTIVAGIIFELLTSSSLFLLSFFASGFIASLFNNPDSAFLMVLVNISILPIAISTVVQSVFIGFENMKLVVIASSSQAVTQSIVAPLLVLMGFGAVGAIAGFVLASLVACMVYLFLLYTVIFRKLAKVKITVRDVIEQLKPLLKYGIPLAIGTILGGLLVQFSSFLMASYVSDLTLIGNYKIATNFAVLVSFFTVPITMTLFPAFSKLDLNKESQLATTIFTSSVKYASLILVPVTMGLIVLANPAIGTLYGEKWPYAASFLALIVAIYLYSPLGSLCVHSFLSATGETKLLLKLSLINLLIGIPVSIILIPSLGITGMLIAPLIVAIPNVFIALFLLWKKYKVKVDLSSSIKIFFSSTIAAIIVYILLSSLTLPYALELGIGLSLFLVIYIMCIPMTRAIGLNDIANLKSMISDLGPFSKILTCPLIIMEKLLKKYPQIKIVEKACDSTSKVQTHIRD